MNGAPTLNETQVRDLYREAIVLDSAAPALGKDPSQWRRYADGGVSAVLVTLASHEDMHATMATISTWLRYIGQNPDKLVLAESVDDIRHAKASGRFAVVFHFQNGRPLGRDVGMVEVYRRLGVRVIQITNNHRNHLGDGCMEPENGGLSVFGRSVVNRMNALGVLVDLSHVGERTSLDAMEVSARPDVFTHSNARAVYNHPRNITDEQAKRIAEKNGVIGICAFPAFITDRSNQPSMSDLVDHLDHFVQQVGIDHVGLGVDFYDGHDYQMWVDLGIWDPQVWPAPPYHFPVDGTNVVDFALALSARGYGADDITKVLAGNFLRVFDDVWQAPVRSEG